ncbi:MAG: hypothetical protein P9M13_00655 [Candidatus Ancaeobacter aquaticus]|nr:hypothetical protein [Candidatus Ancaeobacter aquaticus]
MKVLLLGSALLFVAFFLHVLLWNIRIPKHQVRSLLVLFFFTLIFGLFAIFLISSMQIPDIFIITRMSVYLHVCFFYVSVVLVYIVTYPAIEVDSPSLVIIMSVAHARADGLAKDKLYTLLTNDVLVKPRVDDLIFEDMLTLDGDRLRITKKGSMFIRIFVMYRKIMNLNQSNG